MRDMSCSQLVCGCNDIQNLSTCMHVLLTYVLVSDDYQVKLIKDVNPNTGVISYIDVAEGKEKLSTGFT